MRVNLCKKKLKIAKNKLLKTKSVIIIFTFLTLFVGIAFLSPSYTHAESGYCYIFKSSTRPGTGNPSPVCVPTEDECNSLLDEQKKDYPNGKEIQACTFESDTGSIGASSSSNSQKGSDTKSCGTFDVWCKIKKGLAVGMLTLAGWILGISGWFFDRVLTVTVKEMAVFINDIKGIDVAWRVIRDMINMAFIFILLYIAIATILRIEEYGAKKLLSRVVIIALLINFSLFFTKVIVDISNVISAEFIVGIEQIGTKNNNNNVEIGVDGDLVQVLTPDGIAGAFAQSLQLTTLYGSSDPTSNNTIDVDNILTIGISGTIFLLIAAFIFFAGALLLVVRFIVIIFLMVTSPIAFAGMILPATKGYAQQWWKELFKQAIFAPVYMALLLVVAVIVNDSGFQSHLTNTGGFSDLTNSNVASNLQGGSAGAIDVILNFVIVSGLMIMALVTAQKMGVQGAAGLTSLGKDSAKWIGRRGLRYAGGKWNQMTHGLVTGREGKTRKILFAALNPVSFAKGWEKRAKERLEEREILAEGAGEEVASWIQSRGREKIPAKDLARRQLVAKRVKEMREGLGENFDKKDAQDLYGRVHHIKGLEGDIAKEAYKKLINSQGYGDDEHETLAQGKDEDGDLWRDKLKLGPEHGGTREEVEIYNSDQYQMANWVSLGLDPSILRRLRSGDLKDTDEEYIKWQQQDDVQEKLRVMSDLSPIVREVGHYEGMYMATKDPSKGLYRPVIDEDYFRGGATEKRSERSEMIHGEVEKLGNRTIMQRIAWHALVNKEWDDEKKDWQASARIIDEHGNYLLSAQQIKTVSDTLGQDPSQATHAAPRTSTKTVGLFLERDGSFKKGLNGTNPSSDAEARIQFKAFRKLNPIMVDAFTDIYLGNRPGTTGGSHGSDGSDGPEFPHGTVLRPTGSDPRSGTPV